MVFEFLVVIVGNVCVEECLFEVVVEFIGVGDVVGGEKVVFLICVV